MRTKMKIGLIGTFIRDRIFPLNGHMVESIGGLYHSLANAAFLSQGDFEIIPLARVGKDFYPELIEALSLMQHINLNYILQDDQPNTRVDLIYKTQTTRQEITTAPMKPLTMEEVSVLRDCDGIIINMITGEDVSLEAVQWLSRHSRAMLYLDFHTLALGRNEHGRRFYRRPPTWELWLKSVTMVQMNEEEARLLAGYSQEEENPDYEQFIRQVLSMGLRGVHVTLGDKGAISGFRHSNGEYQIQRTATIRVPKLRDIIGCGDAFGAAFVLHYFKHRDFFGATQFATKIATLNTVFLGSINRDKFEEHIKPYANFEN